MILTKTPFRMSFIGGGTDLPSYYLEYGGAVVSTAIDKYMYIAVHKKFDGRIRLNYSRTEEIDTLDEIAHPLFREVLDYTNVRDGVEISSMADIPSQGSGLGSSSSFTVGLLKALYGYRGKVSHKAQLGEEASFIEIEKCKEPIGKQDQYSAAYGGLNLIRFNPDDSVVVEPIICTQDVRRRFMDWVLVFYTGRTRSAGAILSEQNQRTSQGDNITALNRMAEMAVEFKTAIEKNNFEVLGALLDENWRLKRSLAAGISDSVIDMCYDKAMASGAIGGKLLGAGFGGFMMFFAPPETHDKITAVLPKWNRIKFGFDNVGSQIVFFQPE